MMIKVNVSILYEKLFNFLPLKLASNNKILFGTDSIVKFDFTNRDVILKSIDGTRLLGRIEECKNVNITSISSFSGTISGNYFKIVVFNNFLTGLHKIEVEFMNINNVTIKFKISNNQKAFKLHDLFNYKYIEEKEEIYLCYNSDYEDLAMVLIGLIINFITYNNGYS